MTTTHEPRRHGSADRTTTSVWGRRARRAAGAGLVGLFGVAYWTLVRPRMLGWGATPEEVETDFPGDDLLPTPDADSTMAVDVDAPPSAVWPWLCQLGQERGGFYSYEWAENLVGLDIHNADEIREEWQDLAVGDTVRLGRADRFPDATLEVAAFEPERSLVLRTPDDPTWWVWSFVLEPVGEAGTRLLVRSRIRLPENPVVRFASLAVLDPVSALMTHGMLRGLRERAERLTGEGAAVAASEEGVSR